MCRLCPPPTGAITIYTIRHVDEVRTPDIFNLIIRILIYVGNDSLEYAHEHPDPTSSDTPPSTPSDHGSHPHVHPTKRRPLPSTGTGVDKSDDHDNESRRRHRHRSRSSSGRFLARMIEQEDRDSKKMNSLLVLTNERLEGETVRANDAERKASELIKRFREVIQARDLALQETARAREVRYSDDK